MVNNMFVHYSGTIAAFKQAALESTYANSIVFISGDAAGNGAAIYTHNKYYASLSEALTGLKYFSSISDGKTTATASGPEGVIAFTGDNNNTVSVVAGTTGIKIGLSDDFMSAFDAKAETSVLNGVNGRLQTVEANYETKTNVANVKSELQGNIDKKLAIETYNTDKQTLEQTISDNLNAAKKYTDDEITELGIPALSEKVTTLIGNDANLSVREIAINEIATQLSKEGIDAAFDTLEEMAKWLSEHPEDVTAMNEAIQASDKKADAAQGAADAAQATADDAVAAAGNAQNSANQANTAIAAMDFAKIEGFVTSIEQVDGKVTATKVDTIAAEKITVADANNKLAAANVEAALAELAAMWEWEEL